MRGAGLPQHSAVSLWLTVGACSFDLRLRRLQGVPSNKLLIIRRKCSPDAIGIPHRPAARPSTRTATPCSFINSLFDAFGSGIVAGNTAIVL
jgi:hypothetical protein